MKVLETLNFTIYDPSLICIEILGYRDLSVEKREINDGLDEIKFKYRNIIKFVDTLKCISFSK